MDRMPRGANIAFTALVFALLLMGCGGAICEKLVLVADDAGPIRYDLTCIHECGRTYRVGFFYPAPTCEWEHDVCVSQCADGGF